MSRFFFDNGRSVQDDHVPFLEHGLPAADIIDFDYGPLNVFWHADNGGPIRRRERLGGMLNYYYRLKGKATRR